MAATTFNADDCRARPPSTACFGPLDPSVVSDSLPAFFIGRNANGFWVARERQGRIGGIFLLKSSALAFAHRHAGDAACATIFPTEACELDIANSGNRLIAWIAPMVRALVELGRSQAECSKTALSVRSANLNMTLLSHDLSCPSRVELRLPQGQKETLKSAGLAVLIVLISGGMLAAIIGLKAAIYLSRIHLGAG